MIQKTIVGSEEWCNLTALNIPTIKIRIDSGAKTSALHAINIVPFQKSNETWVKFDVNPIQKNPHITLSCEAKVIDKRIVKSSSGDREMRYVILTEIEFAGLNWEIELTLTNRDSMGYRMLLGREAMAGRLIVDPEQSFLHGQPNPDTLREFYFTGETKDRKLKIGLLASNPELYSNKRIIEAGELLGHEMHFINVKDCYIKLDSKNPEIHYRNGHVLKDYDAIIPRIKPSMTYYGCSIIRQFEALKVFALNGSASILQSRDKLFALQLFLKNSIEIPTTGFANSPLNTSDLISMVGGAPLIVKLLEGTQGKGVVLAETNQAAESVINAFKSLNANILVQEFIKEADGKDLRLFIIDGKVVATMERTAAEGEFRANIHMGGTGKAVKATPEEKKIALRAAKTFNLKVAGVDIIRSKKGPLLLEVNSSPGLEGIEGATQKDIATKMIHAIEKQLRWK